jgi:hypothetical protein
MLFFFMGGLAELGGLSISLFFAEYRRKIFLFLLKRWQDKRMFFGVASRQKKKIFSAVREAKKRVF